MPVDDAAFSALAEKISAGVGLTLGIYKQKCIRRRVAARMRACGVQSYDDYGAVLDRSPDELARLQDALTINVTRFYRNAATWQALRETVVPALCAGTSGPLHIWSAGCASGEEAYTAAMLFADCLRRQGRPDALDHVFIDATDIDHASLAEARLARYRPEAVVELPAEYLARYLVREGASYVVAPAVRERVRFRVHELSGDRPPRAGYHLVLCRNVVIYFARPAQEQVFLRFADALVPEGYLVLGKVETLVGDARLRLAIVDARERIYRRST